jgi:hypothetical protein
MSYGMQILSTEGLVDVTTFRAARLYASEALTTSSGTRTVSGFSDTDGFIFVRSNTTDVAGEWSWDNSTKVLTWAALSNTSSPSTDMTAFFMVTT